MTVTVNIHEAKTQMSKLLARVESGETVIIARRGVPVAEWRSLRPRASFLGAMRGQFGTLEQIDAAFSDEAEAEIRAMFDDTWNLDDPA